MKFSNVAERLSYLFERPVEFNFIPKLRWDELFYEKDDENKIHIIFCEKVMTDDPSMFTSFVQSGNEFKIGKYSDNIYIAFNDFISTSSNFRRDPYSPVRSYESSYDKSKEDLFELLMIQLHPEKEDRFKELLTAYEEIATKKALEAGVIGLCQHIVRSDADLKARIERQRNDITSRKNSLLSAENALLNLMRDNTVSIIEGSKERILKELENIASHKKVTKMEADSDYIYIHTVPLYINEPIEHNRYYLGSTIICIPYEKGSDILIKNPTNCRKAFWNNSPHPHVDGYGHPCFGNLDSQLVQFRTQEQYYGLFLILLGYLETCNIEDCAGESVTAWDLVDENGKVINDGEDYEESEDHDYYDEEEDYEEEDYEEDEEYEPEESEEDSTW